MPKKVPKLSIAKSFLIFLVWLVNWNEILKKTFYE